MFPKCSLDVQNITALREHSANIPGIVRAGWEEAKGNKGNFTFPTHRVNVIEL